MNKKLGLFAFLSVLVGCIALLAQTSVRLRYIYDENRRLLGVIDENNNALVYSYDAAGNLVSTERLTVRGAVDILFVEPNRGRAAAPPQPGTPVTIHGIGFSTVPAQNQVTFNGVAAVVDKATATTINTSVPAGATTGPVQVASPQGTATSRSDFTVTNLIVTVRPDRVDVGTGQRQQFTATVTEVGTVISSLVVWSVSPMVGTIDGNGLYTAPAGVPSPPTVTVTATSVEEPTSRGTARVNIVQSMGPIFASTSYRMGALGVASIGPIFASASYRRAPEAHPMSPITIATSYTTIAVTGLTPSRVLRGATNVPFTVTGGNFNGATMLDFLLPDGVRDSNIAVSTLSVNPGGTQITGRISVAGAATAGARTAVVRTQIGPSATTVTASNQLVIE